MGLFLSFPPPSIVEGFTTMPRGPKKHLKRLNAPAHWMLDKLGGTWAPKPSAGPHKMRECFPLVILLRNRLKYALTKKEVTSILMQRLVKVDGKVRTDPTFPAGFQDVITIEKTDEVFRLLYDTKGRFIAHRISAEESKYKLGKVRRVEIGKKGIPYLVTHDGRTIRYPDPNVKVEAGNLCMVTAGRNIGRVGLMESRERHAGSFDIIHVKDAAGQTFATRGSNVFIIGQTTKSLVSLPKRKGIKTSIIQEQQHRLAKEKKSRK